MNFVAAFGRSTVGLPFFHFAALFLGLSTVTRGALLGMSGWASVPLGLWPGLFVRGLGFDAMVLAFALAPALAWVALRPKRWPTSLGGRWLRPLWFGLSAAALLFLALSELTFWLEFSSRLNFIALDYLMYTQEVIGNVRQSYPVGWLLAGVAALALGLTWFCRASLAASPVARPQGRQRLVWLALAVLLPTVSWQLADLDDMAFSGNAFANELSGNGLMTLAAAIRRNELDYERFYATLPEAQAQEVLQRLGLAGAGGASLMAIRAKALEAGLHDEAVKVQALREPWPAQPLQHPARNVVLITVESLSAQFVGSLGDKRQLTPRLDALAKDGLLFTHMYATGTRTVRGLEATSLGTPPIPGQSIVRRPHNEHLATLGELLSPQGVQPLFFYGGYGYFDNMNAYFAGNAYRVRDRTDIPKSRIGFQNVWGVGDEFLFDHVIGELDQQHAQGQRFMAHVMTTSNHRPYTYASGRIDIPSPGGREGAVKYTDFSIGHFMDQAKTKPWFRDTVFVILADHCASAAGKTKLPVTGYHIPMLIYAPALIKPGRYEPLVSQIDVPPTILELLGAGQSSGFFGTSVFSQGPHFKRRAFISNYQELGYLTEDRLVVLGPKRRVETFAVDAQGQSSPVEVDAALRDEAVAYYQSAARAFKTGALQARRL
jgi:phosphoglycerol transferase MdoB-like AlkP superfamily enzyme